MSVYDKEKARLSFDRAAHRYDQSAKLQQHVAKQLIDLVSNESRDMSSVLDIGCGTGQVTEAMCRFCTEGEVTALDFSDKMLGQTRQRLLNAGLTADLVCADAEQLPFTEESFDLIVSSLMLQWCNDLRATLSSYKDTLKAGGGVVFSTFTEGTLRELKQSWQVVDQGEHASQFLSVDELEATIRSVGFSKTQIISETIVMKYPTLREMIMEIKQIGASNAHNERERGLTGKQRFQAFENAFERYRLVDGQYPCSWEVAYVIGYK